MSWFKIIFPIWALRNEVERLQGIIAEKQQQIDVRDHSIANLRNALDHENLRAEMAEGNCKRIAQGNDALVAKIKGMKV